MVGWIVIPLAAMAVAFTAIAAKIKEQEPGNRSGGDPGNATASGVPSVGRRDTPAWIG